MERAAAFYGALMGWTSASVPGTTSHRLLQSGGKTVASLQHVAGGSDGWTPHVSVESIERSLPEARSLGATLIDTLDISGLAKLATLRDPEGAVFGLWQPQPHQGADVMEGVGSLWWVEVLSGDVAGACKFYESLFGWTSTDRPLDPFASYTFFKRGDVHEGGLLPIDPDWEVSPRWNSIFSVEDGDATIRQAEALGGCEIFTHTVPTAGRIGVLTDSGGATFVIRGPIPKT
jgi:predicted enzyme related to lactoylglutathione lyase